MPQSEQRREYMRRYMQKRRSGKNGGDSKRGVNTPVNTPTREERGVNTWVRRMDIDAITGEPFQFWARVNQEPTGVPMNPNTMTKRQLVEYLEDVGKLGFSLATVHGEWRLVANTGELVPFDGVSVLVSEVRKMREELGVERQRNTQLEADLARLEMMMDSMLREAMDDRTGLGG